MRSRLRLYAQKLWDKKVYERTLFNGNIVSDITGLKGKELGSFMAGIKDKIDIYGDVEAQVKFFYIPPSK